MGMESSPRRQSNAAKFRRRQEKRWAKKSGPVTVRFVDPATLRPAGNAESATAGPNHEPNRR